MPLRIVISNIVPQNLASTYEGICFNVPAGPVHFQMRNLNDSLSVKGPTGVPSSPAIGRMIGLEDAAVWPHKVLGVAICIVPQLPFHQVSCVGNTCC